MSEIFFIGDTHFGHKNIINFSATKAYRPFDSIEAHDAELIKRWNSVVTDKDTVYHLGDVCFGARNLGICGLLNGNKKLILGNHDLYNIDEYRKYFTKIYGAHQFENLILTHIPVHTRQLETRFIMNIHGHLHANNVMLSREVGYDREVSFEEKRDWRYYNVSCEQIKLTPVPYDVIIDTWAANN